MTKCPPGTTIRQVQGTVDEDEEGSVLLQVDGSKGRRIIRLDETLIVPGINLFSLQRLLDIGYIPVYGEVANKCIIKKVDARGQQLRSQQ